mmetsp:Transcript_36439/g.102932  ORF Transcript_36439/g.102932 Transcript_36439/m.102932 type:complete len:267 (-) Transcript_36439:450-1250(-)
MPATPVATAVAQLKESSINPKDVEKAFVALQKYVGTSKEKSAGLLDDDDELVYLLLALKKMPQQSRKDKPVRLALPHSLWADQDPEVCLFVKDREGEGHKAAKKRLAEETKAGVKKVLGVSKLKAKYEAHEAKRALCNDFDLFLADDRILPLLPKLIGKTFFKKKKQPIPVDLTTKDWAGQVQKALAATYMFNTGGSSLNIKVCRTSFDSQAAVDNVLAVVKAAVERVPKKWSNVQAVYLKTAESAALPILQVLPTDGASKIGQQE